MPNFVTRSYPRCHPPAAFPNIPGLDAPEVPAVIGPEPGAGLVFELPLIHTGNDRMDVGLCPTDRGDAAMKPTELLARLGAGERASSSGAPAASAAAPRRGGTDWRLRARRRHARGPRAHRGAGERGRAPT